jgi:hypothetical protein
MKAMHSQEELEGFLERLHGVIARRQRRWRESAHEEERWFSRLRLDASRIDNEAATFLFGDTEKDVSIGYRWPLWIEEDRWDALADPDDSVSLFNVHIAEDVATTEPSAPDADGVRWLGDV